MWKRLTKSIHTEVRTQTTNIRNERGPSQRVAETETLQVNPCLQGALDTDYNGGFVFPGAIDKIMLAEIKLNGTSKVRAFALDLDEYCEFGLNEEDAPEQAWARYIFGVCREIQKRGGVVGGFDTVFAGDVPLGAGMSSSAALESTFANALNELFNLGIDKFELARIGQSTEHNYCGVKCGIMDQFASIFGSLLGILDHILFI